MSATQSDNLSESAVGTFVSKIGLVLSKVKDTIVKDFIDDLKESGIDWEEFKFECSEEGINYLDSFINKVIAKLGYDLSSGESKDIQDLIKSLFITSTKLGSTVSAFIEENEDKDFNTMLHEYVASVKKSDAKGKDAKDSESVDGEKSAEGTDGTKKDTIKDTSKELFEDDKDFQEVASFDFKGGSASVSLCLPDNLGKIQTIIELVQQIVDLVKQFSSVEWESISNDMEDFGEAVKNKFISEEFGKKVLDYVLLTLFKNAKEVFSEDINGIVDNVEQYISKIEKDITSGIDAKALQNDIIRYRDEILEIEEEIEKAKEQCTLDAQKVYGIVTQMVPVELESRLNVAKKRLASIVDETFGGYSSLATLFDRIYAIFDLLGFIGQSEIPVIASMGSISSINGPGPLTNIINSTIDFEYVNQVTTTIKNIKWEKIQQLFTDPKEYFKSTFKIEDISDAEDLLIKVLAVVRSFNGDIPEITSAKQLIWEIIHRIEERLQDELEPVAEEIKEKFNQLKQYLTDLLKVIEAFVMTLKKEFTDAFDAVEEEAESIFTTLRESIEDVKDSVMKELEEGKDAILENGLQFLNIDKLLSLNAGLPSEEFEALFIQPLLSAVGETAPKYFSLPDEDTIRNKVKETINSKISISADDSIIKQTKTMIDGLQSEIKDVFSEDYWIGEFESVIANLRSEFEYQTRNVPDSFDDIKDIVLGKGKNPFSDLDINAYFSIIGDKFKDMIPFNPNKYYREAATIINGLITKDVVSVSVDLSTDGIDLDSDDFKNRLEALAADVLSVWWDKVKTNLYNTFVRPYERMLTSAVKNWSNDLYTKFIPVVCGLVEDCFSTKSYETLFEDVEDYTDGGASLDEELPTESKKKSVAKDGANTAKEVANATKTAVEAALNLLKLVPEAKEIDSWKDGVKFAINLYKIIPSEVKKQLKGLINLPDWDFSQIHLPEYELDTENKFLAVNVYKWSDKNDTMSGGVNFQIVAFVGERSYGEKKKPGLFVMPVFDGNFGASFNIGDTHMLQVSASADLNKGMSPSENNKDLQKNLKDNIGLFFTCEDDSFKINVEALASTKAISAYAELLFRRGHDGKDVEELTIFEAELAKLTLKDYPQKIYIGYKEGEFDAGYLGELDELKLSLLLANANDFFKKVLSNDIDINLKKLALGYSIKEGFNIEGDFYVSIPIKSDIDLKYVKFKNIAIEIGGKDGDLVAGMKTSFTVNLDVVGISFSDMGLGCKVNILDKNGKGFGSFNVSPEFTFPDGLGIAIDAEAVKGAGLVQWKKDEGQFLGALSLEIMELCGASCLILFTTGNETTPFSFMGALSVFFNPGIQLGMGFSLNAIGGSLGVNRTLDLDKLRDAVYDGSLSSILFVKDLDADKIDKILANITTYYPQKTGGFYFGVMTQLRWADIIKADLGLFIAAPKPVLIFVAGELKISVAEAAENLLAINVSFMGGVDTSKGLFFDASLHDSQIVGIDLYGDMALRLYWAGDTKGFILSAGGFHPQYTPEAGFNLPKMRRMGLKLDYEIVKMSLEAYFAVTSNTVQFGSDLNLVVGWDDFGLVGYMKFNALFQFKPFKFMVDMSAGLAVKLEGVTLLAISLDFALSGPSQWNVNGKASFFILFIKVDVDFDYTWGKKQVAENRARIDILPLYTDSFKDNGNWKAISTDLGDNLVTIAAIEDGSLVILPSDKISFCQSSIPLNTDIEKYGDDDVNDYTRLDLIEVTFGNNAEDSTEETAEAGQDNAKKPTMETAAFAPASIKNLSEKEKLSSKSYLNMDAGFRLEEGLGTEHGTSSVSESETVTKTPELTPGDENYVLDDLSEWKALAKKFSSTCKTTTVGENELEDVCAKPSATRRRSQAGFSRYTREADKFIINDRQVSNSTK